LAGGSAMPERDEHLPTCKLAAVIVSEIVEPMQLGEIVLVVQLNLTH
jgi:hypothetical protein